jgi:hypothetical protein
VRRALLGLLALAGCIDAPRSAGDTDAGPDAPDQLLLNPGFEEGAGVGWIFEPGGSPRIATGDMLDLTPQAGDYAAEVGGVALQNDTIAQEVVVPAGATGLTLTFHHCVLTEEPMDDDEEPWDYCHVRAALGDVANVLYEESNKQATPDCVWGDAAVSVTPFTAGAPLQILLIGTNDEDAPTRCLYDSFALVPTFD